MHRTDVLPDAARARNDEPSVLRQLSNCRYELVQAHWRISTGVAANVARISERGGGEDGSDDGSGGDTAGGIDASGVGASALLSQVVLRG